MGWSIGFDTKWNRDIGYGVPCECDHPKCKNKIDRGLAYVCCEQQPYGGENGCGLYFCSDHRGENGKCERCEKNKKPFKAKPDIDEWIQWKLTDESWAEWRKENEEFIKKYYKLNWPKNYNSNE